MSTGEKFDDILRTKLGQEQPLDEGSWQNARNLIDTMRKRKRRRVIAIVCFAGLLCSFGAYETISLHNNKAGILITPVTVKQSIPGNKAIVPVSSSTNTATENKDVKELTGHASTQVQTNPVKESPANNGKVVNNNRTPKEISDSKIKTTLQKQPSLPAPLVVNSKTVKNNKPQYKDDKAVTENNGNKQETNNSIQINNSNAPGFTIITTPGQYGQKSDKYGNSFELSLLDELYLPLADNKYKVTDTISAVVQYRQPIFSKPVPKSNISVELGGGYSLGWKYGDTAQGNGIYPVIGIGYTKVINDKWSIKTGLQFSTLGNMGSTQFVIKHVNYDFVYNAKDTALTTQRLYYITLPLQVEYKLGKKNAIGVGGTLSYLVNSYGKVSVYNVSGNTVTQVNSYAQNMDVKGFNPWNVSIFVLYKRNISDKLSIYLIPYFGLLDLKSNSFFSENTFERDSGVKLLLSYNIL
ncbi:MAG TPA: hypothetical protein VNY36_01845 [Bacteroidia bacterium]|jgi:hypothetical protein|nr:hypothetical protein [Bacteroidia bacterium]